MTKKEAFAGGIRSSQSTVFKNLKKVEKILCTKQNIAMSTIDINKYRKHNTKIGLKIVFYVCLGRCQFLYNIHMYVFSNFFIALFL